RAGPPTTSATAATAAITSFLCKRMASPGTWKESRDSPRPSRANNLHLGALRLVLRELERLHRVAQRELSADEGPDVDTARRQIRDGPVEFDAPPESAAEIELLRHQLVDDEGQRLVRQRSDLDDARALF